MARTSLARRLVRSLILAFLGILTVAEPVEAVVISEIHYNPRLGQDALEFIEIANDMDSPEDISGWALVEGVRFTFAQGTILRGGEFLVVAADAEALSAFHDIENVAGSYEGRLDSGGERVALVNHAGIVMQSVRYRDEGKWPVVPDGTGHSLILRSLHVDSSEPESWTWSPELGGSPGVANFPDDRPEFDEIPLVELGDDWRFRRGTSSFSSPPTAWRDPGFDDSDWEVGPSGFGYGDGDDATILEDMENNYTSLAIRRMVELGEVDFDERNRFFFEINYDDGFCAFINGVEFARGGCPEDPRWNQTATRSHEATVGFEEDFEIPFKLLRPGENVLAILGFNRILTNNDFSLLPTLRMQRFREEKAPFVCPEIFFNELARNADGESGWVELFNGELVARDLSGWRITDDPDRTDAYVLPDDTVLSPGGFLVVDESISGLDLSAEEVRLFLLAPGNEACAAAVFDRGPPPESALPEYSEIRFPDGRGQDWVTERLTRGAPNEVSRVVDIVINEIFYRPPEDRAGEFLELYNRGADEVDLSGFRFTKGIDYTFPNGVALAAGEYLVLASEPQLLREIYGLQNVLRYEGSLANGGENLRLVDVAGNLVDEVRYFDGGDWSRWADGGGSSLELIDPRQDNDFATAWGASIEDDKSEWELHSLAIEDYPFVSRTELHVLLGARGVCRLDDVSIVTDNFERIPIVDTGEEWRYRKGTEPFSDPPDGWREVDFDDSSWLSGASGFGYGDDDDTTVLEDMRGADGYASLAIRKRFEISQEVLDSPDEIVLGVRYDDAFCAFVNGVPVESASRCPEGAAFDAQISFFHEAEREEIFRLPRELLRRGENVLAIVGYNLSRADADFTLDPRVLRLRLAGQSDNFVPNSGFEEGTDPWIIQGTHVHSERITHDAYSGEACLEMVATGRGDSRCNRLEIDTEPRMPEGLDYELALATRWVRGTSLLILHGQFTAGRFPSTRDGNLSADAMGKRIRLKVPENLGTPGAENSVHRRLREEEGGNLGPVMADVRHTPASPEPGLPVVVEARVSDADGVGSVHAFYGLDTGDVTGLESVELSLQDDGLYRGQIPPLSQGPERVGFYIEAVDGEGRMTRFPPRAPERLLVYSPEGDVEETLQIVMPRTTQDTFDVRTLHSNDLLETTVIYNQEQVFYNVGVRYRGSPWGRNEQSFRLRFREDQPFKGTRTSINLTNRDRTDGAAYFLIGRNGNVENPVASADYKYAPTLLNGRSLGKPGLYEPVDRAFIEKWFGSDVARDAIVLKGNGRMLFNNGCSMDLWDEAAFHHREMNTENYRFYWSHSLNANRDDWSSTIDETRMIDANYTSDEEFDGLFESVVDVEAFARVAVPRLLMNDTDALFIGNGHNGYLMRHPGDGRWRYLPFDMGVGWRSPPGSLFFMRDRNIARVMGHPRSLRVWYRVVHEFIEGYWSEELASPFLRALNEFVPFGEAELRFLRGVNASAQTRLEPFISTELQITTNGGDDIVTPAVAIRLHGEASVLVTEFLLQIDGGAPEPFEPLWKSATEWEIELPLSRETQHFDIVGLDTDGNLAGMTGIGVTRTSETDFVRGDANADGRVNIADALATLGGLFGDTFLACADAADFNDDSALNLPDVLRLLEFVFQRGAPPAAPFPQRGADPTEDALECRESSF